MESEKQNANNTDANKESSSAQKRESKDQMVTIKTTKTDDNINIEISSKGLMDLLLKNESIIIYKFRG